MNEDEAIGSFDSSWVIEMGADLVVLGLKLNGVAVAESFDFV